MLNECILNIHKYNVLNTVHGGFGRHVDRQPCYQKYKETPGVTDSE